MVDLDLLGIQLDAREKLSTMQSLFKKAQTDKFDRKEV